MRKSVLSLMLLCALLVTGRSAPSNPTEQTPIPTTLVAETSTGKLPKKG